MGHMVIILRKLFGILMAVIVSMGSVCAAAEMSRHEVPSYLPYQLQERPWSPRMRPASQYMGASIVLADVDQDGSPDMVYTTNSYLAARSFAGLSEVMHYQVNFPVEYCTEDLETSSAAVAACGDLSGDGRPDLVTWGPTTDGSRWWFWVLDLGTGEHLLEFALPIGRDARRDGKWDGVYYVAGALDVPRDQKTVRALIIGCTVGYDKYGRGVMAVDPTDGAVLWRYETGPVPFRFNTGLADLDGDGTAEIIFVGRSPDNLHGERINGFSDDETRLFVLDRTGHLRWSRFLGVAFGNGELALGDMDGDSLPEIVTSVRTTPKIWGQLTVWDRDGEVLAQSAGPRQLLGVQIVSRTDRPRPSLLVTDNVLGLLEFDFRDGELVQRRAVAFQQPTNLSLVADILPDEGVETVVACVDGLIMVLDQELKPLAAMPGDTQGWGSRAIPWQPMPNTRFLLWPDVYNPSLAMIKTPFAWQRLTPYAVAAVVLIALTGAWLLWRRNPRVDAVLVHETRLTLLDNLELSHHGAIAPLKCVRRLTWHLRALQTNLGDTAKIEIRMREAWSECRESALPHLSGILERARLAGVGNGEINTVSGAIIEIRKQLEALAQDNFRPTDLTAIAEALESAERQADAALVRLRGEVASYFRADVARVVSRVRVANDPALSQARINFRAGLAASTAGGDSIPADPPPPAVVLCDPRELEFILDNLVGNAVAAMAESPTRELGVTWHTTDGMVIIDVADTGCGLPTEKWDRALNSRYSTKPDGGKGLPESRKYLHKYGGTLTILRSTPGHGSTFRIILPLN